MFLKRPSRSENDEDLIIMERQFLRAKTGQKSELIPQAEKVPVHKPTVEKAKVKKTSLYAQRNMGGKKDEISDRLASSIQIIGDEAILEKDDYKIENVLGGQPMQNIEINLFQQLLATKSTQEVMEMKKWYMDKMGPETTSFLMNKSKTKCAEPKTESLESFQKTNHQFKIEELVQLSGCEKDFKKECVDGTKSDAVRTSADKQKPKLATRFGMCGEIIADDCDYHDSPELFHHDEDPERAGYTIQELFAFVRSTFNQQQDIGLKMLSCIVKQAKLGSYYGRISSRVVPILLEGDVGFWARLALDSSAQTVVISAIEFLQALIVNSEDETALDHTFSWHRGHEQPIMSALEEPLDGETSSDEDITKADLVEGLLKMSLVPRISYLTKLLRSQTLVVGNLLDIVIRICRHNDSQLTPNLEQYLESVVKEFLPLEEDPSVTNKSSLGPKVIKIMRLLASSGVEVAGDMLDKYGRNVFQHLREGAPANVYLESMRFLVVLLRYRLAFDVFQSKMEFVVGRLRLIRDDDSTERSSPHDRDPREVPLLLGLVGAALDCLCGENESEDPAERQIFYSRDWSKLMSLCCDICKYCLEEFKSNYYIQKYTTSTVLTAALNCTATCMSHDTFSKEDSISMQDSIEDCLKSESFGRALTFLRENSFFSCGACDLESIGESSRSFKTLESLWVDRFRASKHHERPPSVITKKKLVSSLLEVHDMELISPRKSSSSSSSTTMDHLDRPSLLSPPHVKWHPVLHPLSTHSFLLAMARVVEVISKKTSDVEILKQFLSHPGVHIYLSKTISSQTSGLSQNWFTRYEVHFLCLLIKMANQLLNFSEENIDLDVVLYHNIALNLMTKFAQGDEAFAIQIMKDVIFNKEYFRDSLHEDEFKDEFIADTKRSPLLDFSKDILENFSNMSDAYISLFFSEEKIINLKDSLNGNGSNSKCLMIGKCNKAIFSNDWLFQPLRHLYSVHNLSRTADVAKRKECYEILRPLINLCKYSIRAIFLFEKARGDILENVPLVLKLSRLMQAVIAAGKEIEEDVSYSYLDQIMEVYAKCHKKSPIFWPALSIQLYDSFLDVFNQVFGGVLVYEVLVLMPLVLCDDSDSLWKLIWTSRFGALRCLTVPLSQFPCDVGCLLNKTIDVNSLIRLCYHSIRGKLFTHTRTPIPYLIAIHALNDFLFYSGNVGGDDVIQEEMAAKLKQDVASKLDSLGEPARLHVLLYKRFNAERPFGFELYDSLPTIRRKHLDEIMQL